MPFNTKEKFDYWKAKDADEALGVAFEKYRTLDFYIGETTKYQYDLNTGKIKEKPLQRQDSLISQLKDVYKKANEMGCYDAADLIKKLIDKKLSI
jgi:hypothetical protein